MEEKKKVKISLKTAIILIVSIIIVIVIGIVLFSRFLNKQNYNYYETYTAENSSLGIFNELGLNWKEVNTYNEFQIYMNKINELYNINSQKNFKQERSEALGPQGIRQG